MQDHAEQVFSELSTTIAQAVGPAVDALLQLPESELETVAALTEQVRCFSLVSTCPIICIIG